MYAFERLNKFLHGLTKNMAHPVASIVKNYSLNERTVHFFICRMRNIDAYMSRWPEGSVAADNFAILIAALKSIGVAGPDVENNNLQTIYHPQASRVIGIIGETSMVTLPGV